MTPYLLFIALLFILAVNVATAKATEPPIGGVVARQIVATWNCQDHLRQQRTPVVHSPWGLFKHSKAFQARELNRWVNRYRTCRTQLAEIKRQWNWQAWLPDKWRRIGVCETQLNWFHYNSSYEGAFGFATSSWDSFKPAGYPDHASQATPWQQYQVALAIYNRYGFSGWGCRGA